MKLFTSIFAIVSFLTFGCMSAIASPVGGLNLPLVDKVLESSKTVVDTAVNAANTTVETGADVTKTAADTVGNLAGSTGISY